MLWKSCHGVMTVRCSLEAVHKKERMNEVNTHLRWAKKELLL